VHGEVNSLTAERRAGRPAALEKPGSSGISVLFPSDPATVGYAEDFLRHGSSGDTIPNSKIAIRSIFSTCNALCQGGLLTLLDVPTSVCYPSGRRWQRRGPKPGEQRNLDLRIGRESASRHDDCQHQGGRGPAVRGKVNPGEVLIKVVIRNKPKMLSGLNQKVRGRHRGFLVPCRGRCTTGRHFRYFRGHHTELRKIRYGVPGTVRCPRNCPERIQSVRPHVGKVLLPGCAGIGEKTS